jgi:cell pole-organizing protein PopZ
MFDQPAEPAAQVAPVPTPSLDDKSDVVDESAAPTGIEGLLSPLTRASVTSAFDALTVSMTVQNSSMVEDAVRDMLRPMLKDWLDNNLPTIVERLVRTEIERAARGGRS